MRASRGSTLPRLRRAGGLVALLLLVSAPMVRAQDTQEELDAAQKKLKAVREDFREVQDRRAALQEEITSITTRISQALRQKEALEQAIGAAETEITAAKREAEQLQARLNDRARDAYIRGPAGALELVLESESLAQMSRRYNFLEVLSQADANLATGLAVERQQVAELRKDLKSYLKDHQHLIESLEAESAALQGAFEEAQALEAEMEEKYDEAKGLVAQLEARLQQELLARYGITSNSGPPLSADGPFYWCPVDAPRSYIDDFGFPRVGHTHQGNDIFASYGAPIRAPFAGMAEESSNSLGGLSVHVYASANADYVYNAHLSGYAGVDGGQVNPGDVIGYVGDSGNAAGTPPHNHFEYHPGGGSAISPYLYLNEVCGVGGSG
jgi:murein DD-endopeptidase MepM/ murein hydrolase activator NlpD